MCSRALAPDLAILATRTANISTRGLSPSITSDRYWRLRRGYPCCGRCSIYCRRRTVCGCRNGNTHKAAVDSSHRYQIGLDPCGRVILPITGSCNCYNCRCAGTVSSTLRLVVCIRIAGLAPCAADLAVVSARICAPTLEHG